MVEASATGNVDVLVRNDPPGHLPLELIALFSFSISRALDSLEQAVTADVRLALTHQVIDPLERARATLIRSIRRPGSRDRFVLPRHVVTLCDMQFRALYVASLQPDFCWQDLPRPLADVREVHVRFRRCAGLASEEGKTDGEPSLAG